MSAEPPTSHDANTHHSLHRTSLASFRTQLALDRTTLAWIRTAMTMASFGLGMVAFFHTLRDQNPGDETAKLQQGAIGFGFALIVLGFIATMLAGTSHWLSLRRLRNGRAPVLRQWPLSITVAILLSAICMAGVWALFAR